MGTTSSYISLKLAEWQSNLTRTSLTNEDREELTAHLEDMITELTELGLSEEEVWSVAAKRIGSISAIEAEFEKVNPDIPFRKNGLLMIYGAVIMLFLQSLFVVVPAFLFRVYHQQGARAVPSNDNIWPVAFNILTLSLIGIILAFTFKGRSLAKTISKLAFKLNILTAFISAAVVIVSGFFIIQLISLGELDTLHTTAPKFKTLTQIFYFGLIGLIGYFLLIGNNQPIRTLSVFNRKINWKTSLLLGGVACLAIIFSYTYAISYLPLFIGCPLFAALGWMISFSEKKGINLFCAQLPLILFCISELSGRYAHMFGKYYLITLCFLLTGALYQRTRNYLINLLGVSS
ncbi:permease prefix domain 1-containing protein [Pedobacter fastidiosus]|uniref:Uncharacterized protein n=1 Tax=Pedobacter fastidiosus TaxID=2765361 RepID=A0ABR7KWK5_9SPHI|nr:permease prefix domain 1-containing protein [Pedobacter fastidiosus]MBC6112488.1 hypothetical protein [Pedobacter fastidiosus]